jgi:adenosylcobinamide-phosphate synthase
MTTPELSLAYAIDLLAGDPEWFPHPVKLFGLLIKAGDRRSSREMLAGTALTLVVVGTGWAMGRPKNPVWRVLMAWTTLATRSLLDEARAVIDADNLPLARQRLARIVGRDTAELSETEIARAVIETLAESACDGIVAPLFWLAVGGVPFAMAYKAINTLDSMIGHSEPPYRHFGRFAARLDDAASFIPARLTALGIIAVAPRAWPVWRRDGNKHLSPNAGQSEAAMAGALAVQLGGPSTYDGHPHNAPLLNVEGSAPTMQDARAALRIVAIVSAIAFGLALLARRKR